MKRLDEIDRTILALLQANARMSNVDIAKAIELAPSATLERVKKLESLGVIRGYEARLDPQKFGSSLTAFIALHTTQGFQCGSIARELSQIPEVEEVHVITGDACLMVKVRAKDPADLSRILHMRFASVTGIIGSRSTIVLETLLERSFVPQSSPGDAKEER